VANLRFGMNHSRRSNHKMGQSFWL
jgi:hypothetical protein